MRGFLNFFWPGLSIWLGFTGLLGGTPVVWAGSNCPPETRITLPELYADIVDDLFERQLEDFHAVQISSTEQEGAVIVTHTFDGMRFTGFPKGGSTLESWESKIRLELYFPKEWVEAPPPLAEPPLLHVVQIDGGNLDNEHAKRALARWFARKLGGVTAIWSEDEFGLVAPIRLQSLYNDQNDLQQAGFDWMMAAPQPLSAESLRFDFRYATGQGNILCTTFFRRFLPGYLISQNAGLPGFPAEEELETWVDGVRVLYDAGSKAGGGAVTAAGLDSQIAGRAVALRVASYQVLDDGPGGLHRLETDWQECADDNDHFWEAFAKWLHENKDACPSYYDTYLPSRDPQPYENLKILELVGTHDWIFPLGTSTDFWENHDHWDYRLIRRINNDHGRLYFPEEVAGDACPVPTGFYSAGDIALWRLLSHLKQGTDWPRIDPLAVDLPAGSQNWSVTVQLTGNHAGGAENFRVWVALSDDRDFRRCTCPVTIGPNCKDGNAGVSNPNIGDDNLPEEDKFILAFEGPVTPSDQIYAIPFSRPQEWSAFDPATPPIIALIVEVRILGNKPNQVLDDLYLHTRVLFTNDDLPAYAPFDCEQP